MTVTLTQRGDITLEAYYRVAWQGEEVRLDGSAKARMTECRAAFLKLLDSDSGLVVYGVTSGYGQMAHLRFTPEQRREHARRPMHGPAVAFGDPLPERVVRGIVLARLANFVEGHAAVSPGLALAVAEMLDGRPLPEVPTRGNLCPGEILTLSSLFIDLAERSELGEKDTLALVNGSPCAAALVADAVLAGRARLALATELFALSAEALGMPLGHVDPVLEDFWGDPHEAAALRRLRGWMEGGGDGRRSYQAPVSWRILPRVLGQAGRALEQAEEVARISLSAVSDNPVFVPPDGEHPLGRVLSTGGYHNAAAYPALDNLAAAWADLALLCDRQATKLLDARVSHLPEHLRRDEGEGYLGCLGFTALGYAEEARRAAQRTFLPGSEGGGFGQNDVSVPTLPAWLKERDAARALEAGLACLAAIASQALEVGGRAVPPRLAPLLQEVREAFPLMGPPRAVARDAERLTALIGGKVFAGVAPLTQV